MERYGESRTSGWSFRRSLLVLGTAALLTACGGGGGSGGGGDGDGGNGGGNESPSPQDPQPTVIEGTVIAPAGGVAHFQSRDVFQIALEFFVPPAAAAITGLQPVGGATVELIRVDDDGDQVGDVLATTSTSITGDYDLTVPAGVSLAGNLVVRIQGMGGVQMRAQAVTEEVDISPVSEFVLQKFIDNGADLENLTTSSVLDIQGRVEEFDLTAGADLSKMLEILEAETGEFVDAQVYAVQSAPADGSSIAGDYHHTELGFSMDDADDVPVGEIGIEIYYLQGLSLSEVDDGQVQIALDGEENAEAALFQNNDSIALDYEVGIGTESESFTVPWNQDKVLTIESPFEEDLEGDYGWRQPPGVVRLQKAPTANVFVGLAEEAEVRYRTVDTNEDGINDAVDPDQREGDEVDRYVLLIAEKPADASVAGLNSDYGRVGLYATMTESGDVSVEVERNKLDFDGGGNIDAGAGTTYAVGSAGYSATPFAATAGIPFTMGADGDLLTLDGEPVDGFVSNGYGIFVVNQAFATDNAVTTDELYSEATFELALGVKLPLAMLTLQNRTYRIFFMGVEPEGSEFAITNSRFDSLLRVTSPSTGEIDLTSSYLHKSSLIGQISAEAREEAGLPVEIDLAADGAVSISLGDEEGSFTAEGYMNEDGSLGILHSLSADTGADPSEVGLVVLVEVTE